MTEELGFKKRLPTFAEWDEISKEIREEKERERRAKENEVIDAFRKGLGTKP